MDVLFLGVRERHQPNAIYISNGVDLVPLNPRVDLWDYDEGVIDWGPSGGQACKQTALSLLAEATGSDSIAITFAVLFSAHVARLNHGFFVISAMTVQQFVLEHLSNALADGNAPFFYGKEVNE